MVGHDASALRDRRRQRELPGRGARPSPGAGTRRRRHRGIGGRALLRIEELEPDIALIDIDLGDESGLELARRVGDRTQPILISTHDEGEYADLIAASPAAGFVAKSQLSATAIRHVLRGASPSDERRGT
jgi:DNA-binding NarL/FixJ family response regulator